MKDEPILVEDSEDVPELPKLSGEIWHLENGVPIINWNDKKCSSLNDILGSRSLGLFPTK